MFQNNEISKLEREIEKDPENGDLHYKLAIMLCESLPAIALGHLSLAANTNKRSSGVDKGNIYALMGDIYSKQRDFLRAAKYFVMAHEESPNIYGTEALIAAADYFSRVKEYDQAVDTARKAIEIKPHELRAWELLTEAYLGKGDNMNATLSTLEMSCKNYHGEKSTADKLFEKMMNKIPRLKSFGEAMRELPERLE